MPAAADEVRLTKDLEADGALSLNMLRRRLLKLEIELCCIRIAPSFSGRPAAMSPKVNLTRVHIKCACAIYCDRATWPMTSNAMKNTYRYVEGDSVAECIVLSSNIVKIL